MKPNTHTVLIVDDDSFQQEFLKILLEAEGYKVIIAANGPQALATVSENIPDLILLDLIMPGLSGFQVAQKLKEDPETRQIPIVVTTSIDEHDKRIQALEIGVDDFLNKPVNRIELLVRVKNLLQSRAYFKQLQNRQAHLLQLENLASVGTLITSVTNEINKPLQELQAVVGQAQILSPDNKQLAELLAQATGQIERIDLVVHNMGLYIKSISNLPSTESCDIKHVLKQVLELLDSKMKAANIHIETDIAADLPPVMCSSEGLMHVLVHLLLNAHDALQGCPQPRIKINIKPTEDHQLVLSVSDNNADIAENMYSLISDPLFSTKLPDVCAGLGLALACHFIEKSGGSISVDSAVGRGCCMKAVLQTA